MKFKLKSVEEIEELSAAEQTKYFADKAVAEKEEILSDAKKESERLIEALKKDNISKETIETLQKSLEKQEGILKAQGLELRKMQDSGSDNNVLDFAGVVGKALKEKHDELINWAEKKEKGGWFEIQVKAPGSTVSANITTAATPGNYAASNADTYSAHTREEVFVEDYFDRGTTDKPSLPYVNEEAGEGDATIVGEGSLKPLIDADFNVKYSTAVKIAGRMKASEEALSDFSWLQSAMTTTLKRKHDIARQNELITGTGNLKGIKTLASPFNASLVAGIDGLVTPTKYDVIASVSAAIEVQSEGAFMPNVAFVNTIDSLNMKLIKDDNKNYILPPFITKDGKVIDGIVVVAKPTIDPGSFIIGDFKNVKLRDVWGYTVRIGRDGNDFSENMVTMIGESRLHLYISDNDKRGIISGTFADVVAAIDNVA